MFNSLIRTSAFMLLSFAHVAFGAVFSYQTQINSPPISTAPTHTGGGFTGHLFLSDNNDYIFEFFSVSSPTKEQGSKIRFGTEGSQYWDTRGPLTSAMNDQISMTNFEFEIEIEDEPTGKTFPFTLEGDLEGTISFFDSNGEPYDDCTRDCYMADYVSTIDFDTNGESVTMGNVMYEVIPEQQVVQNNYSSTGVESFLNVNVIRSEFPAGDFDHDGSVTTSDYDTWRQQYGQTGMGLWADSDCNGAVDAVDYVNWRNGFLIAAAGQISSPMSAPEPNAVSILLAGLIPLATTRSMFLPRQMLSSALKLRSLL